MRTSRVGIAAAAILLVVTGIGFGIAQAGGMHSERPVLVFADMEAVNLESPTERPVLSFAETEALDLQTPIETGSLPAEFDADASIVEIDGVSYYRIGDKLYGP